MAKVFEEKELINSIEELEKIFSMGIEGQNLNILDHFDKFEDNTKKLSEHHLNRFIVLIAKAKEQNLFNDVSSISHSHLFMKLFFELHITYASIEKLTILLSEEELEIFNALVSIESISEAKELSTEAFRLLSYISQEVRLSVHKELHEGKEINTEKNLIDLRLCNLFTYQLKNSSSLNNVLNSMLEDKFNLFEIEKQRMSAPVNSLFDYLSFVKFVSISATEESDPQIKILLTFMNKVVKSQDDMIIFRHMIYYCPDLVFSLKNEVITELKAQYDESKLMFDTVYRGLKDEDKEKIKLNYPNHSVRGLYFVLLLEIVIENMFFHDFKDKVNESIIKNINKRIGK